MEPPADAGSGDPLGSSVEPACPECGAEITQGATKCWLCGRSLGFASAGAPSVAQRRERIAAGGTFTLNSIFLVMTLVAVCVGVATTAPGLAVPLVIVVVPALVRTFAVSAKQKATGTRLTPIEKIGAFTVSLSLVILIAVAAIIAFFGACFVACFTPAVWGSNFGVAIGLAALAGFAVAGLLFWKAWPRRD